MKWLRRIAVLLVVVILGVTVVQVWKFEVRQAKSVLGPAVAAASTVDRVQVVCVQAKIDVRNYLTPVAFATEMERLLLKGLATADKALPTLVVYPEDIGAALVFVNQPGAAGKTGLQAAVTSAIISNAPGVAYNCLRYGVGPFRGLALARAEAIGRTYIETFSSLAKKHKVYIIAGSAPLPDLPFDKSSGTVAYKATSGDIYNVSYTFGPDGSVIGRQKKVHLIELEGPSGLDFCSAKLEDIDVVETPFGRIGVAICFDAFHKDVLDRLVSKGATILVMPSANSGPWNEWQQNDWLTGAWKATQDYGQLQYAVNPMMTGALFDLVFEGQSSVVTKADRVSGLGYPLAAVRDGFMVVAGDHLAEEVLFVVLDPVAK